MKNIIMILVSALISMSTIAAVDRHDKSIDFKKLPKAAQEFVHLHFPDDKIVTVIADDMIKPDYTVSLSSGATIDFMHNGSLEKVKVTTGSIPDAIVPNRITNYVKEHYPDCRIVEYETDKTHHEVKLSNQVELNFSSDFAHVKIDD